MKTKIACLDLNRACYVEQGDGVSYESLTDIAKSMEQMKWSLDNISFGSGGALLQKLDRDTQKCAYKCSRALINGVEVNK